MLRGLHMLMAWLLLDWLLLDWLLRGLLLGLLPTACADSNIASELVLDGIGDVLQRPLGSSLGRS